MLGCVRVCRRLRHVAGRSVTYRYWQTGINMRSDGLGFLPASTPATTITSQRLQLSTSTVFKMPSFIVTLKDDVSDDQLAAAKQKAKDAGGKITHEYTLIKAFTVEYPEGTVHSLAEDPSVQTVEEDKEMRTQ
ncbi:Inhibitor I9 domain-containing protein [Trichoderma simmonsii]|uniref:Inhibitor I9 domain-containing protein n=2 Tax=Trichoderma simmonsii TaxID=1491479 RepID=A0A8G0L4H7_9HYPO|nr:Inhibitor I9 domain-containing protein [Trichoderma simmonsii]